MAVPEQDNADRLTVIDVPEAVGVFDSFESLQAAFYDLRSVGFHHSDISLLGGRTRWRKTRAGLLAGTGARR